MEEGSMALVWCADWTRAQRHSHGASGRTVRSSLPCAESSKSSSLQRPSPSHHLLSNQVAPPRVPCLVKNVLSSLLPTGSKVNLQVSVALRRAI
ncbi:hypothetical protein BDV12DRAFT_157439 [Aspergillus spectabilis]